MTRMTQEQIGQLPIEQLEDMAIGGSIQRWGSDAQHVMTMEECAELIKECSKVWRGRAVLGNPKQLEEMADVSIMVDTLLRMVPEKQAEFYKIYRLKLERLLQRVQDPGVQAIGGGPKFYP